MDRLALLGGAPTFENGPPGWPIQDQAVLDALMQVYQSGDWGRYFGGNLETLNQDLALLHDVSFVMSCSSGTVAIELALRACQVESGDEVIIAAYDYPGNFLTIHACRAAPVLIDVNRSNWNLDLNQLSDAITDRTRAMIVSHLHGGVVAMTECMKIARARGILVIEDAAQMPGARVDGQVAGTSGDFGVISFGGSKLLTAGRGGAVFTDDPRLAQRLKVAARRSGFPYPLSELQAAALVPQLRTLHDRNEKRSQAVSYLDQGFTGTPGLTFLKNEVADSVPGYYKAGIQFDPRRFGLSRSVFLKAVRAEGVALDDGFRAIHSGRSASRYRAVGSLGEAERAHHGMVVLHHPILLGSNEQLASVVKAVQKVHEQREDLALQ